jgi:hypothetical protein
MVTLGGGGFQLRKNYCFRVAKFSLCQGNPHLLNTVQNKFCQVQDGKTYLFKVSKKIKFANFKLLVIRNLFWVPPSTPLLLQGGNINSSVIKDVLLDLFEDKKGLCAGLITVGKCFWSAGI